MPAALIPTPNVEFAIHQCIAIDGLDFSYTAQIFGISEVECRRLYRKAKEDAIAHHKRKADYIRDINDEVYERVIQQANGSWEKSKKPHVTKTVREITNDVKDMTGKVVGTETKTTDEQKTEGQNGDPRFLALQIEAADKRSKLHGAEAPKRVEVETKTTIDLYVEIDSLPREERERMAEFHRMQQAGIIVIEEEGGARKS